MAVTVEVEIGSSRALSSLNDLKTAATQLEDKLSGTQFGTAEFSRLSNELKGVRSQLKDFDLALEGLDKEQRATALVDTFNGLTGAVGAVSSAFLAFGVDSEAIDGVEKKLLGVIGVVSGLRDVSNSLVSAGKLFGPTFSAVGDSIKAGFAAGATGAQTFKAALISTGIGAFIVAVGLLVANFDKIFGSAEEAAKAIEGMNENLDDQLALIDDLQRRKSNDFKIAEAQAKKEGKTIEEISALRQKSIEEERDAAIQKVREINATEEKALEKFQGNEKEKAELVDKYAQQRQAAIVQRNNAETALALEEIKLAEDVAKRQKEAAEKAAKAYKDAIDKKIAAREQEIKSNEQYDLAEIESRRIVADDFAKTEEEKAAIDLKFTNERIDRQIKALKESEANKKKEDRDAKALQASLLELENERAAKVIETNNIIEESNKARIEAQTAREKAFISLTQQLGAEQANNVLNALNEQITAIEATTIENVQQLQALRDQVIQENRAKTLAENEQAKQDRLTALNEQLTAELELYAGNEQKLAELKALYAAQAAAVEQQAADTAVAINNSANAQIVQNNKDTADQIEVINQARLQTQLDLASAIGGSIAALGGLFQEGTAAAKAAALADIAVNTAVGFIQGLNIAQKAAAAGGPAAGLIFPIFYATQIAAVLGAASRAKQILGAGGGNPSPPSTPSPGNTGGLGGGENPFIGTPGFGLGGSNIPVPTFGGTTQEGVSDTGGIIKAYVLAGDVTSAQAANAQLQQKRTL